MSYYNRQTRINSDQSPLFSCDADVESESQVIDMLSAAWRCEIRPFGMLCPVDFYALRDNRVVGVLELKTRAHERTMYPTVFLNVRKWLALKLASYGMGCTAIFVVRFTDGLFFIPVDKVPVGRVSIGGTKELVKSHTDIEPVFEIPIELLKELEVAR